MASWPSAERTRLDGVGETAPYWTLMVPASAISSLLDEPKRRMIKHSAFFAEKSEPPLVCTASLDSTRPQARLHAEADQEKLIGARRLLVLLKQL